MITVEDARKILKGQGTKLSDEEIEKIINFLVALSDNIIRDVINKNSLDFEAKTPVPLVK